jgi:transcription antitermination factor NusG
MNEWFALQVHTGREKAVSTWLAEYNLRSLLLTYEDRRNWSDRVQVVTVPLFGGYVLCNFDYHVRRSEVLSVPGVLKIVCFGGRPTPVEPAEMQELLKLKDSPVALQPWPYLASGDLVQIERGPLEGLRGRVVEIKHKARIVVSVSLLQRAVAAEIEMTWVRPARSAPPQEERMEQSLAAGV